MSRGSTLTRMSRPTDEVSADPRDGIIGAVRLRWSKARRNTIDHLRAWGLGSTLEQAGRLSTSRRRERADDIGLRQLLAWTLAPDSTCVDVGAHRGDVLAEMVRLAPSGNHIAVEPIPDLAEALRRRFPTVVVEQSALSGEESLADFVHIVTNPQLSGLRQRSSDHVEESRTIAVQTRALDSIVPESVDVRLIKIDVEGAEEAVLKGAASVIGRCRPVIAFEHGQGAREAYGTTAEAIFKLLEGFGYRIFDFDGHGPYSPEEFRRASAGRRWNWVATPMTAISRP